MMHKNIWKAAAASLLLLGLSACAAMNSGMDLLQRHPTAADLDEQPMRCPNCHDARGDKVAFGSFDHNAIWLSTHRQKANQNEMICEMCHQTSFCSDCHSSRVELKPSLKDQTETYRQMQHRGDYLTRHRIDGRIDPTSCFRCHGNPKTAKTCVHCHG